MKVYLDIHTHNIYSDCCTDLGFSTLAFLKKEEELGMRVVGLSNHIWDERVKGCSRWYKHQTIARAEEAKELFGRAAPGMRVLFGVEGEYFACHDRLGMSEEGADHFDYLLFAHSHLHMRNNVMWDFPEIVEARDEIRRKMTEQFSYIPEEQIDITVNALTENDIRKIFPALEIDCKTHINKSMVNNFLGLLENTEFQKIVRKKAVSIAHSFSPCGVPPKEKNGYLELIPDNTFEMCYSKAASMGVNIELGLNSIRTTDQNLDTNQLIRAYSIAKKVGCKFTFATDAHSLKDLEKITYGETVAAKLGLTKNDIAEFVRDGVDE
ncbi:MAG: hypothetical protein ACI3XQ_04520 [Eubacteriales bacterium]